MFGGGGWEDIMVCVNLNVVDEYSYITIDS